MRSLYILSIFLFVIGSLAVSMDDFQTQLDAMGSDDPKGTIQVTTSSSTFAKSSDAFSAAFLLIGLSEIGDKTFLIAAILAMTHSRFTVWLGAASALLIMTLLSTLLGVAVPALIPVYWTQLAAVLLFFFFGIKLIKEAREMEDGSTLHEIEEVDAELGETDKKFRMMEGGMSPSKSKFDSKGPMIDPVILQAFTLTFVAEWGDRSQIATIALAAAKLPSMVALGAFIAHAACSAVAVIGGRLLASKISIRAVTFTGGILFIIFALMTTRELMTHTQ